MDYPRWAFAISGFLAIAALLIVSSADHSDPFAILRNWQTLLGAGLALVGAYLTVRKIRDQIEQSDRHERNRLLRAHRASRATLPLTLSRLCLWADEMALELDRSKRKIRNKGQKEFAGEFVPPSPPDDQVSEIQSIIRTTDEVSVVEPLAELIRQIQTLWSRTAALNDESDMASRVGLAQNIDDWIIQTAQIYGLAESLFDYSRSETETGPNSVDWDRVTQFLMRRKIEDKALFDLIRRRVEHNSSYWPRK